MKSEMRVFKCSKSGCKIAFLILILGVLGGCSGDEEGSDPTGGISGTGIMLEGTIHNKRALARNEVQIKSIGNPVVSTSISSRDGEYSAQGLPSSPPYLLRVNYVTGAPFYALTYENDGRQNVHAYSDLVVRNWYAAQGLNVNDAFEGTIEIIPTEAQLRRQTEVIASLLNPILGEYGLSGTDLSTAQYQANDQGIDEFLDRNPVVIINGDVNIVVVNPTSNFQTSLTNDLSLDTDISLSDVNPPVLPLQGALRALPSGESEIVLAWDAFEDDIGVSNYEVLRDDIVIGTSTFPSFIDVTAEEGTVYSYTVFAIDASGNRSQPSNTATAEIQIDVTPPQTPENVSLEPTADSIRVSWAQQSINDVSSFTVLFVNTGESVTTTSTFAYQTDLMGGTEYCFQIIAVDGSGNESDSSAVVCTQTVQAEVNVTPVVDPVVTAPVDQTIVGAWGGIVSGENGELPLVFDIETDGENGYRGSFNFPTLLLCDGSLEFISDSGQSFEFVQDSRFITGDCRESVRINLELRTVGAQQIITYQQFSLDTTAAALTGTLYRRSVSPDDLVVGSWGGLVEGDTGVMPVVIDVEAGSGGSLSGFFNFPTLQLCEGSFNFVSRVEQNYEFYQDSRFPSGDCRESMRVTLELTTVGGEQILRYQRFSSVTNSAEITGTLYRRSVSPDELVVGSWGGLVEGDTGEIPVVLEVEAGGGGSLNGEFNFPTLRLCEGSFNFVSRVEQKYEFYQDSRFTTGDCRNNVRVSLEITTVGGEQIVSYQWFNPDTNSVEITGTLYRRSVRPDDAVIGSWGGTVTGGIPFVINLEASGNSLSGDFSYPTLQLCEGTFNFVFKVNQTYEFFQDGRFTTGDCGPSARVSLTLVDGALEQFLQYTFYDPSNNTNARVGDLTRQR